jgi:hypothetical protein
VKLRFQADANLDPDIGRGLQRREPTLDYRTASGVIPDRMQDSEVLELAAADGRVVLTADVRTMPGHFADFILSADSPGLLLVPPGRSVGEVIEAVIACWLSWDAEDVQNQVRWLPR